MPLFCDCAGDGDVRDGTSGGAAACLGIGGAIVFGTSKSHDVMFSELRDIDVDILTLVDKFTRLEAAVTLLVVCGFSNRFTELSTTLGDDLRGGSGGAAGS